MSVLILSIGPETKARIEAVKAYAETNLFDCRGGRRPPPPGDDPGHVVMLGIARVVYSITIADCARIGTCSEACHYFHDFSISVPLGLPSIAMAQAIISCEFGISGKWDARGTDPILPAARVLIEIKGEERARIESRRVLQ